MIALESEARPSNENDSLSICLNIGTKANNWMDGTVCIGRNQSCGCCFLLLCRKPDEGRRQCMNLGETREVHKN